MKKIYLLLTVLGFILPNIFVAKVTLETGNILLYTNLGQTFSQMFANDISTAFIIDLLFIVILFLFWSYKTARKQHIKFWWLSWVFTFVFGIASGLPLFLYLKEKNTNKYTKT